MKRFILTSTSIMIILFMLSCNKEEEWNVSRIKTSPYITNDNNLNIEDILLEDTLRILHIGNSYTDDATSYLPGIVYSYSSKVDMQHVCYYKLTRAAGSFNTWFQCFNGNDSENFYCTKVIGGLTQPIDEGKYPAYDSHSFIEIIKQKWDLIIIQQVSTQSNNYSAWNTINTGGYLYQYLSILKEYNPDAVFAYSLVHSYQAHYKNNREGSSLLRWENNMKSAVSLTKDYPIIQKIIPYGTAIQNLRETDINNPDGELTKDGSHLSIGIAKYTASCTLWQSLFYKRTGVSIIGNTFRISCSASDSLSTDYKSSLIDVTDANAAIAQRAADFACQDFQHINNPMY